MILSSFSSESPFYLLYISRLSFLNAIVNTGEAMFTFNLPQENDVCIKLINATLINASSREPFTPPSVGLQRKHTKLSSPISPSDRHPPVRNIRSAMARNSWEPMSQTLRSRWREDSMEWHRCGINGDRWLRRRRCLALSNIALPVDSANGSNLLSLFVCSVFTAPATLGADAFDIASAVFTQIEWKRTNGEDFL